MQEVQSIEEVLKERSQVDELRAQLQQEQQASRAKDQQLQAHIEQTATEMQARRIPASDMPCLGASEAVCTAARSPHYDSGVANWAQHQLWFAGASGAVPEAAGGPERQE
jgi:GTP cyclohydrolase FolE2